MWIPPTGTETVDLLWLVFTAVLAAAGLLGLVTGVVIQARTQEADRRGREAAKLGVAASLLGFACLFWGIHAGVPVFRHGGLLLFGLTPILTGALAWCLGETSWLRAAGRTERFFE